MEKREDLTSTQTSVISSGHCGKSLPGDHVLLIRSTYRTYKNQEVVGRDGLWWWRSHLVLIWLSNVIGWTCKTCPHFYSKPTGNHCWFILARSSRLLVSIPISVLNKIRCHMSSYIVGTISTTQSYSTWLESLPQSQDLPQCFRIHYPWKPFLVPNQLMGSTHVEHHKGFLSFAPLWFNTR